jgi:uncharacterized glyoxalase superfamily protein PhnB
MANPDMIGMIVSEMAVALKFYRLLGLEIPPDADAESHVEAVTTTGFRIAWDTVELMKTIHDPWVEPAGHRMILAFRCDSPSEVDELYLRVLDAGYEGYKPPWDAFWGQRYAIIIDPDGNLVDLFAPL